MMMIVKKPKGTRAWNRLPSRPLRSSLAMRTTATPTRYTSTAGIATSRRENRKLRNRGTWVERKMICVTAMLSRKMHSGTT